MKTKRWNEFDRSIGHRFTAGGKRFKIRDFMGQFDFPGVFLENLSKEPTHRELGRIFHLNIDTLSDDESD
jgi:hypothetical protein